MNNNNPPITLKQALFLSFGVDLPIRGGKGIDKESAIIIEHTYPLNDYVSTEYLVLKYLRIARGLISWNIVKQQLIVENAKTYDVIEVNVVINQNGELLTQTEYFYFDITECFGPENESQESVDKNFAEMKLYVDKLLEAIVNDKAQKS